MSERIVYVPEGEANGSINGILSMIPGLISNNQMNPMLASALMNGQRNQDMWGGAGCWWIWIILLFGLGGFGGYGGGLFGNRFGGGLPAELNGDAGRELLMQAIQGNANAISQIAQSLGTNFQLVQSKLCDIGTAIERSGWNISKEIGDCCCKTQQSIQAMGYENQLSNCHQTNTLVNTMNSNTLSLRDGATANTQAIINKLDAMQNQALLDKIDALREKNSNLQGQLSQEHQTLALQNYQAQALAPVNAALSDLSQRLASIECKQPPTVSVPYTPAMGSFIPVNYGINVNPASTLCGC